MSACVCVCVCLRVCVRDGSTICSDGDAAAPLTSSFQSTTEIYTIRTALSRQEETGTKGRSLLSFSFPRASLGYCWSAAVVEVSHRGALAQRVPPVASPSAGPQVTAHVQIALTVSFAGGRLLPGLEVGVTALVILSR